MMDLRDLALPVIGAPMAGGPSTAALVAAVSDAGGLGFLAAGYKNTDAVATQVATVRAASTAPFGVNLFVVEPYQPDMVKVDRYRRALEPGLLHELVTPTGPNQMVGLEGCSP